MMSWIGPCPPKDFEPKTIAGWPKGLRRHWRIMSWKLLASAFPSLDISEDLPVPIPCTASPKHICYSYQCRHHGCAYV